MYDDGERGIAFENVNLCLYELVHLVAKSKQSQLFETTKGRTLQCGGIWRRTYSYSVSAFLSTKIMVLCMLSFDLKALKAMQHVQVHDTYTLA